MLAVVVVGSGPTGQVLGGELAMSGVDVSVSEQRSVSELEDSRAEGLYFSALKVLRRRGMVTRSWGRASWGTA